MTARKDILAGKAAVELRVNRSEFMKALDQAEKRLTSFGQGITSIGAKMMGVGTVITGSLMGAVRHFAAAGDELDKMSQRTGVSATALAELGFAAEQSGGNLQNVESTLQRMAKNLSGVGPESNKTVSALDEIGLSAERIRDLAPEDQFQAIADGIGGIENPTRRAGVAMAIFGEGGRQLLPMLENMRELRKEARDLGLAPSEESVKSAAEITDAMNRVRRVIGATIYEIGATVAPMAQEVLGVFQGIVNGVRKFVTENRALVVTIAKVGAAVLAAGAAVVALGTAFIGAGAAIAAVSAAIKAAVAALVMIKAVAATVAASMALIASPVVLIGIAIGTAAAAWLYFSQSGQQAASTLLGTFSGFIGRMRAIFGELSATVTAAFSGIRDAIAGGDLELAGQIAMTALRLVFLQGMDAIQSMFSGTMADIVGTFGKQIAGGDFAGAWATVVSSMSSLWESFAAGIVTVFTSAARSVTEVWQNTVDGITNYILQQAAKGGAFGKAFEMISGIDMQAEAERDRRLKGGRRTEFDDIAAGTYQDPATRAIADSIRSSLQGLEDGAIGRLADSMEDVARQTAGGAGVMSPEAKRLADELEALTQRAAEGRERMRASAAANPFGGFGAGGSGGRSFATFSAAAATAMGQGGAQDAVVRAQEKTHREIKEARRQAREDSHRIVVAINALGLHH